jgi:flagellar M-ring protein FliF
MGALMQPVHQAHELWQSWPPRRRLSMVVTTLAAVALFGGLVFWGSQPNWTPLMTGLTPEDASAIVERLDRDHTPYRLANSGSAILVREEDVHAQRVRLAGEGLPRGGDVGFELFDDAGVGVSRFTEQINFRRALEGELQRTIRSIDAVREARVHVVMPERRLFAGDESAPSASVTVHLHPGRRMTREQVQAVVHLMASSVAGLSAEEVTVIDGRGSVLAKGGDNLADIRTGLQHQAEMEKRLEGRVREILEQVVGPGNASVRAHVELDQTHSERTTESFDPDSAVVRSEQVSEESRGANGAGAAASGIPGARSNLGGGPNLRPGPGAGGSGRRTESRNYELTKTTSREVRAVGRVARVSVAVVVDGIPQEEGDGSTSVVPRSPAELARLASVVKAAIGFDAERGDQVDVQSIPFEPPVEVEEESPFPPPWLRFAERILKPVVLVALLGIAVAWFLRRRPSSTNRDLSVIETPRTVREVEASLRNEQALPPADGDSAALQQFNPDPAQASAVVRTWLGEG